MSFKQILETLTSKSHARGAVMLDWEGEVVDSFSVATGLELDAIGAHKGLILNMLKNVAAGTHDDDDVKSVAIQAGDSKIVMSPLKDGYYLLVVTDKFKPFGRVMFESKRAAKEIEREMG
ncbi:MAG: hypothetical protein WA162_08635 [Thermodesulfobacteriota bacterium]